MRSLSTKAWHTPCRLIALPGPLYVTFDSLESNLVRVGSVRVKRFVRVDDRG